MMPALAVASALPPTLSALPTGLAVSVLCVAVVVEIVAVPGVLLPGGTMTLLAGALIGSGRPVAAVAIPVVAAVIRAGRRAAPRGAPRVRPGRIFSRRCTAALSSRCAGVGTQTSGIRSALSSIASFSLSSLSVFIRDSAIHRRYSGWATATWR